MSQFESTDLSIDPYTTSGVQLAVILNRIHAGLVDMHAGTSRPAYAKAGTIWYNTSTTPGTLMYFDGTSDAELLGDVLPTGGTAGQLLAKVDSEDGNAEWIDPAAELPTGGTTGQVLAKASDTEGDLEWSTIESFAGGLKNLIMNGCFRVWQRGISQQTIGYASDDRWYNGHLTSTKTHSRQTFTPGQTDVPGNPQYYSSTDVTTGGTSASFCKKEQRIEGVARLSGETVTLSFYAKADAAKNIAIGLTQYFGATGSALVSGIGGQLVALTDTWARYEITTTLPSVSGLTIAGGDDYTAVSFWFEAGADYDAEAVALGNQSGIFDIAQVQLEISDTATEFEKRFRDTEKMLCFRYCYTNYPEGLYPGDANSVGCWAGKQQDTTGRSTLPLCYQYPVEMRVAPTVTLYSTLGAVGKYSQMYTNWTYQTDNSIDSLVSSDGARGVAAMQCTDALSNNRFYGVNVLAEAEL